MAREERQATAVGPVHDDVAGRARDAEPQGLRHGQLVDRVVGAVGAVQPIDARQVDEAGRQVLALAEELASAGVDQDRLPDRPLHEEDARRHVGDQRLEHPRDPAILLLQRPLLGDVLGHAVPAVEQSLRRVVGRQRLAHPARRSARDADGPELVGDGLPLQAHLGDGRDHDRSIVRIHELEPALVRPEHVGRFDAVDRLRHSAHEDQLGVLSDMRAAFVIGAIRGAVQIGDVAGQQGAAAAHEADAGEDERDVGDDLLVLRLGETDPADGRTDQKSGAALAEQIPLERTEFSGAEMDVRRQDEGDDAAGEGRRRAAAESLADRAPDDEQQREPPHRPDREFLTPMQNELNEGEQAVAEHQADELEHFAERPFVDRERLRLDVVEKEQALTQGCHHDPEERHEDEHAQRPADPERAEAMREAGSRIDRGRPERLKSGRGKVDQPRDKDEEEDGGARILEPAGTLSDPAVEPPAGRHLAADQSGVEERLDEGRSGSQHADREDREREHRREAQAVPGDERQADAESGEPEVGFLAERQEQREDRPADHEQGTPSPRISRGRRESTDGSKSRHSGAQKRDAEKRPFYGTQSLGPKRFRRSRRECAGKAMPVRSVLRVGAILQRSSLSANLDCSRRDFRYR